MTPHFSTWIASRCRHGAVATALVVVTLLNSLLAEQLTLTGLIEEVTGTDFFDGETNLWLAFMEWGAVVLFIVFWGIGWRQAMWRTIMAYTGYVTVTLAASVAGLVATLTVRKTPDAGFDLLWDAFVVWTINVLIFAVWYWLLDGRGETTESPARRHFLFPQQANPLPGWAEWTPGWFDYLFLAFSHSTAFSTTDTPALSRRAKLLIMVQASISLITLAMIAARAVNVIG